jgi:pimeloyl-ACP methyl ester carboxylesterase
MDGEARCGWYSVYENRATHQGRRLALKVVVLSARRAASHRPDPIFLLTGGPGIGVATEPWTANVLGSARDDRDVVLVDQRGTGASAPLECDLYGTGLTPYLESRFPVAAVRRCRESLAQKADLTQYTSSIAADDLDEVRAALGHDKIDLAGFSYGSKLAFVYLRQHPATVRRVVLEGVVPTAFRAPLPGAAAGDRALRGVFHDCAVQPSCARAYPQLETDFRTAMAHLDSAPAPVRLSLNLGRPWFSVLTRRAFLSGVWAHLYSPEDAREIPRMIHHAARGDFTFGAQRIALFNLGRWPRFTAGAMLAMFCTEDVPFITETDAARAEATSLVGAPHTRELMEACVGWPRGKLPNGFRDPVKSDVPVLLLSGEFDPITAPEWAASAARTLSQGRHVVRAGAGHDVDECTQQLIASFIAQPEPGSVDTSCAARTRRSDFWVD